jgi:hypothetical protein
LHTARLIAPEASLGKLIKSKAKAYKTADFFADIIKTSTGCQI